MASYSMLVDPRMAAGSFGGGRFGGVGDIFQSMQTGFASALPIMHSLYDFQDRAALSPYQQEANIAALNNARQQNELSALGGGIDMVALNRLNNTGGMTLGQLLQGNSLVGQPMTVSNQATSPAPQLNTMPMNPAAQRPGVNFTQSVLDQWLNNPPRQPAQTFPVS